MKFVINFFKSKTSLNNTSVTDFWNGVALIEIAPGVDLQNDVLDRMGFAPQIDTVPKIMDASLFYEDGDLP